MVRAELTSVFLCNYTSQNNSFQSELLKNTRVSSRDQKIVSECNELRSSIHCILVYCLPMRKFVITSLYCGLLPAPCESFTFIYFPTTDIFAYITKYSLHITAELITKTFTKINFIYILERMHQNYIIKIHHVFTRKQNC